MNILIALDSSGRSEAALAAALSRTWPDHSTFQLYASVLLRHCPPEHPLRDSNLADIVNQAHRVIEAASVRLERRYPNSVISGHIDTGDAAGGILALAESWPADVIILGSHDCPAWQSALNGTVASTVLSAAPCSLLFARNLDSGHPEAELVQPLKRVLIAVDASVYSRSAVASVLNTQWPADCRFYVLAVVKPAYNPYSYEPSASRVITALEQESEMTADMEAVVEQTTTLLNHTFGNGSANSLVAVGDPAEKILEAAKQWRADLITIGSAGRPGLLRRLLGSVSRTVALKAPCSVHLVRGHSPQLVLAQPSRHHEDKTAETETSGNRTNRSLATSTR